VPKHVKLQRTVNHGHLLSMEDEGCWLKNSVSGKTKLSDGAYFMVSGVKQPYSPPDPCASKDDFAPGLDRYGGDYKTILTDGPTGCCAACYADTPCKSWTYVEADPFVGCHMKDSFVPLVNDSCVRCTSGAIWGKECETSNLFDKGLTYCEQTCFGWCWATSTRTMLQYMPL